MTIEEIIKKLNYISGVHTKYMKEEVETLRDKLKELNDKS
jgi:hypothetical protein